MTYKCPKCGRLGMEWDGRAKVIMCYYNSCNHVIKMENHKDIPSENEIVRAIEHDLEQLQPL